MPPRWTVALAPLLLVVAVACTNEEKRGEPGPPSPTAALRDDGRFHPALSIDAQGTVEGSFDLRGAGAQVCWSFSNPITALTVELTGPVTRSITTVADGSPPGTDPDGSTGGCGFQRLPAGRYATRVTTVGTSAWRINVSVLRSDVVRIPDVRGEKEHTVGEELAEHGLEADARPRCDLDVTTEDGVPELGEIIAVERAGDVVPLGTRVTVGWLDFRILGSVVGQDVERARELLEAAGYRVQVDGSGTTVRSQTPRPEAAVCADSTVELQT